MESTVHFENDYLKPVFREKTDIILNYKIYFSLNGVVHVNHRRQSGGLECHEPHILGVADESWGRGQNIIISYIMYRKYVRMW